jgi:hypothetical protein
MSLHCDYARERLLEAERCIKLEEPGAAAHHLVRLLVADMQCLLWAPFADEPLAVHYARLALARLRREHGGHEPAAHLPVDRYLALALASLDEEAAA